MKTERRHDLETNDLARMTAEGIEKVKPFGSQLFGTALVIVGILILLSMWGTASDSKEAAAWTDYALALDSTDQDLLKLQSVAEDEEHAGSAMQEWAYITWADRQTALASYQYLRNREDATDRLERVEQVYENLEKGSASDLIVNRARFGLGRVYEMQNRLEEAQEKFDAVQGNFALIARSRSENLLKPEVQEACNWLASAELPKAQATGATGDKPLFDVNLPGSDEPKSRSLEDILGFAGDEDASGRYGEDSAADEEKPEAKLDDIFQDEGTEGSEQAEDSANSDADSEETAEQ